LNQVTVKSLASEHIIRGMELNERIKHARNQAGLSQEALGAFCVPPVSKGSVYQWERGEDSTTPTLDNLVQIAKGTGVSLDWLLTGQENKNHLNIEKMEATIKAIKENIDEEKLSPHQYTKLLFMVYYDAQDGFPLSQERIRNYFRLLA